MYCKNVRKGKNNIINMQHPVHQMHPVHPQHQQFQGMQPQQMQQPSPSPPPNFCASPTVTGFEMQTGMLQRCKLVLSRSRQHLDRKCAGTGSNAVATFQQPVGGFVQAPVHAQPQVGPPQGKEFARELMSKLASKSNSNSNSNNESIQHIPTPTHQGWPGLLKECQST